MVDEQIQGCIFIITFLIEYENNLSGRWANRALFYPSLFFNRPFSLTLFNQGKIYHFFILKSKGQGKGAYVRK